MRMCAPEARSRIGACNTSMLRNKQTDSSSRTGPRVHALIDAGRQPLSPMGLAEADRNEHATPSATERVGMILGANEMKQAAEGGNKHGVVIVDGEW